ncbi:alkaline shock response membrane anchor protein AmaP [Streptomyces sp. NBC_00161]|uniref:alkaline shock response membrane anchor protein AmaP n=1 Tax=Streptomyces sp. NBC_00161 TaxID=2975671 RepID=UPI00324D3F6D
MKRKSVVNRILLASTGILLLGAGCLMLASGFDLYRRWHLAPPDGWPLTAHDQVLLTEADRTHWTTAGWWWPAVIAALTVVVLLALWWLLAQLRRTHPGHIPVQGPPTVEGVELREQALSNALAADARQLPGIRAAAAQMDGSRAIPKPTSTSPSRPTANPGPSSKRCVKVRLIAPARQAVTTDCRPWYSCESPPTKPVAPIDTLLAELKAGPGLADAFRPGARARSGTPRDEHARHVSLRAPQPQVRRLEK